MVTDSGGKDSAVCREIARRADIPYEVQHNLTTADASPTIYYVRETFRKLEEQADICFQNAFSGFLHLEEKSSDDRLQYRLGQMLYTGTGTERDDDAAADYWERVAKLGNVHA